MNGVSQMCHTRERRCTEKLRKKERLLIHIYLQFIIESHSESLRRYNNHANIIRMPVNITSGKKKRLTFLMAQWPIDISTHNINDGIYMNQKRNASILNGLVRYG